MRVRNILFTGISLSFALLVFNIHLQGQGMKFYEGNWVGLKAEAKKQHKPFFVDCYTSWCGPCKMMATKIFPQKIVGDFYNANFICYSVDMEKGEGPDLARYFNVKFYPTLLYFNEDGELMHRIAGGVPADVFVEEGQMALDPKNNLMGRIKRFEAGERDTLFLLELVSMANNGDETVMGKALNEYWKAIPDADRLTQTNWERFKAWDHNINSAQFNYVKNHKDLFIKKYGEDEVNKSIFEKAAFCIQHAAETRDENLMKQAKAILESSDIEDIVKFASLGEMMYYKSTGDMKTFGGLARKYVDKYAQNNADELSNMAFECASGVSDIDLLHESEKWIMQSIKIKMAYANMDTYAHILFKLGKIKEAEQTALEAIELAGKENVDPKGTKELLAKIKAGKN